MEKTVDFYKKKGRWYAAIPEYLAEGGSEEDCEMIFGADKWLENHAKGNDQITLKLSSVNYHLGRTLQKICEDQDGAVYIPQNDNMSPLWLCNVSKYVWGNHPDYLYYKIIN